ncbi:MAG: transposase [Aestuariivita sp.]|nr:transposase [Aestuariivita sp.]
MKKDRTVLTDNMWKRIKPLLSGKKTGPKRTADNHLFLEAVLWRDLQAPFGNGNSVLPRFYRWVQKGLCARLIRRFRSVGGWPDYPSDYEGLRVRNRGSYESVSRSKGGLTSRTVTLMDAMRKLIRFDVLLGQSHDLMVMKDLFRTLTLQD